MTKEQARAIALLKHFTTTACVATNLQESGSEWIYCSNAVDYITKRTKALSSLSSGLLAELAKTLALLCEWAALHEFADHNKGEVRKRLDKLTDAIKAEERRLTK